MDKYKDKLLSSVSHDLKTPLNCMVANIEAAIIEESYDKRLKYLSTTLNNIKL